MRLYFLRVICFIFCSTLQVKILKAETLIIPSEEPQNCIKGERLPCSISTGNQPRMFTWGEIRYELDRNIVMNIEIDKKWNIYNGLLVVETTKPVRLHTPFADIFLENSKAMIHVLGNKVRVLSLKGEGIRVKPKGEESEEQYLVPGFQNWYGGVEKGFPDAGVAMVIDFDEYSNLRSPFFLDHQLGFPKELAQVASQVKWAAKVASQMHRDLVERKMASLEVKHQKGVNKDHQKIQFNKYLRKLFLKKIQYDY